jgi:hypothetical protein
VSAITDHIKPHRGDYTAFGLSELRSLCAHAPQPAYRPHHAASDPRHP